MSEANEAQTPPSYEALLNNLRNDREYAELPGPEIAMWPEDVAVYDDLSNQERFNERFLEPKKNQQNEAAYVLYFFFGVFNNFGGGVALYSLIVNDLKLSTFVIGSSVMLAIPWFFFAIVYWTAQGGGVRFNRQAQLVHFGTLPGVAKTYAWRDVKPFLRSGIETTGKLELCFPLKPLQAHGLKWQPEKHLEAKNPSIIDAAMDSRDHGPQGCMHRFEFYRRYMEEGLDAVQPDPERLPDDQPIREPYLPQPRGPILKTLHFLAAGPLIDRALAHRAKQFYWPEEVERLCAPDADLSGID
uniref:hypothetical protein n=1 Tax=Salinicola aestuarinus TaxID=1949082 RepID=UPI001CB6BE7E